MAPTPREVPAAELLATPAHDEDRVALLVPEVGQEEETTEDASAAPREREDDAAPTAPAATDAASRPDGRRARPLESRLAPFAFEVAVWNTSLRVASRFAEHMAAKGEPGAAAGRRALADLPEGDAALAVLYGRALELERRDDYPSAVVVYDALLARVDPAEYGDARARRDTLVALVEVAREAYARAKRARASEQLEAELVELELIQSFWSGYRDVEERVSALRRARKKSSR